MKVKRKKNLFEKIFQNDKDLQLKWWKNWKQPFFFNIWYKRKVRKSSLGEDAICSCLTWRFAGGSFLCLLSFRLNE